MVITSKMNLVERLLAVLAAFANGSPALPASSQTGSDPGVFLIWIFERNVI